MVKSKNMKRAARLAGAVCAAMLMAGCGQKPAPDVVEYPIEDSGIYRTEEVYENDNYDSLTFKDTLRHGNFTLSYDLEYTSDEDIDRLPTYEIKMIESGEKLETDIVNSLFGDTAVPMSGQNQFDYTFEEDEEDFIYGNLVKLVQDNISYEDGPFIDLNIISSWIDKDRYFSHVYEGQYNGLTCRLLIFYSYQSNELNVIMYPKDVADAAGDPKVTAMDFSDSNGSALVGKSETARIIDITNDMSDRPNISSLTDDEISAVIYDAFKDVPGMMVAEEQISLYDSVFSETSWSGPVQDKPMKCECIYYTGDSVKQENFPGAVRKGYAVSVGNSINGIPINTSSDYLHMNQFGYKNGVVLVDDRGVIGFKLGFSYSIENVVYDDTSLMDFKSAMKGSEEVILGMDLSEYYSGMYFRNVDLVYMPDRKGKSGEYELVPAWMISASGFSVLINAVDGTVVW